MTNENKAKEIVDKELNGPVTLENRNQIETTVTGHCTKVAIEMAEWKDQQFKEYLEDRLDSVENYSVCCRGDDFLEGMIEMLNEIINELFGE